MPTGNRGRRFLIVLHDFVRSEAGEPHLRNRVSLLAEYPEIAKLFGYDVRTFYVTLAVVVGQFAVAAGLEFLSDRRSLLGSWWSIAIVAWSLGAFMNHWGGVVIHEAAHNLCSRAPLANRWLAIMANFPIGVPSAMSFRRHHLDHHRYLGVPGLDNDLPTRFEVDFLGRSWLGKVCWVLAYPFFGTLARGYLRRPRGWEVTGFLVQMAVNAVVVTALGWTALGYLLLSTYFAYGPHPIAGHFVHEHYLLSGEQETHSYYGPLNALTLNMGFHNEHHDFPGIPGTRLPELHRIARSHYASLASHRSWAVVLWIFLHEHRLGHHSRIIRTLDVFRAATQMERARRTKLTADRLSLRPAHDSNALASS
jgi:sphingolipid delta-4 desaturase